MANSKGFGGWSYNSTAKSFHRFDDNNKVPVAAELERLWVSWGSARDRDYMSSREIQDELSDSHGIRKDFGEVVETLKKYRHRP